MCLSEVYPENKIIKEGVGYKAFRCHKNGFLPFFYFRQDKKALEVGKWIREEKFRLKGNKGRKKKLIENRYPYGFHLFKRLKDAKHFTQFSSSDSKEVIKKVKFRKGCAIGLNVWALRDLETIVAKEIFIPI